MFRHHGSATAGGKLIAYALYPDARPLNESLGDVFGQFIESDFVSTNSLAYNSTPRLIGEAEFAVNPSAPGGWIRNLVDPHLPGTYDSGGPDSMTDCLYDPHNSDEHVNASIPNRAWSLATFGGIDSTTGKGVDPSIALGMSLSEQFYLMLIQNHPTLGGLTPGDMYHQVAQALVGSARMRFGDLSPQERAIACAWFGVSVLSPGEFVLLGFHPFPDCASGQSSPCQSQGAGAPANTSCGGGTGTLSSCPGTPCPNAPSGPACSTDGTTLYTCDGKGGTVGGTLCTNCRAGGRAACAAAAAAPAGGGGGPCRFLLHGKY